MYLILVNKTMMKISFIEPDPNDTKESINWYNLKQCDENFNLQFFIASALGWFNLHKNMNFQDFEKELRKHNFNTHLYAKLPSLTGKIILKSPNKNDQSIKHYECIYSCRPKKIALDEVLTYWKSYEENFSKLNDSGSVYIDDIEDYTNEAKYSNDEILTEKERSNFELISNNIKKISFNEIPKETYIAEMFSTFEEQFGRKPDQKIIGLSHDGLPIIGFYIDGILISDIGITVSYDKDMKLDINLVNLQ